ncbi:ribonuclease H family protein [Lactiplantibacillus modestisalitolerans]|uniref:ribonuclease H n=1 Tax=Lactiplantibacillus modestisalitolerans TaxID=1457219 RepID=A0ABV5WWM1_9LACO|nr:ribonuclease H family protein [Lactiplantibacillus modestisalitolerans]
MAQKYYAVRRGRQPGIYRSWPETQKQVSGYPQAQYKSFTTAAAAQAFMAGRAPKTNTPTTRSTAVVSPQTPADIVVYTDGGSRNHGNVAGDHVHQDDPAAWAYRIELPGEIVTDSAGEWGATNNRMEIMAFLRALEQLAKLDQTATRIQFVLDSQYVLNAVTKGWLAGWKRRGWKRASGPLVNAELWQAVDQLLPRFQHLQYRWTKGHATNQGNVYVDHRLNQTMDAMQANQPTAAHSQVTPKSIASAKPKPAQPQPAKPADPATVQKSVAAIRAMLKKTNQSD